MQLKQAKLFKNVPTPVKGAAVVLATVGVGVAGYAIYRGYKRKQNEAQARAAGVSAGKEVDALKRRGIYPTISETQALTFASRLVQAMDGCGTDEKAVYAVFESLSNIADLYMLIKAFGLRYYQPCAADQPISYLEYKFNPRAFGGDIGTWLGYDLSASEVQNVNNILAKKKINYKF
jgi:hypothetical protein